MQQTRGNPYQQRQRQLGSRVSSHANRGTPPPTSRAQQTSQHSGSRVGGNTVNASALSYTDRQLLEQAVIEAVLREGIISGVRKTISGTGAMAGMGVGTGAGTVVGGAVGSGPGALVGGLGGGIAGETAGRGAARLLGGKSSASYAADAAKKNTAKAPSKPVVS